MFATIVIPAATIAIFVLAFALPTRMSVAACRAVAGVAVAVQVVAFVLFMVFAAPDYSPGVLLWIGVGWIVFPLGGTILGLAFALADPPRVVALWALSLALFAISVPIVLADGAFVAPSTLLMFLAAILALKANLMPETMSLEPARG